MIPHQHVDASAQERYQPSESPRTVQEKASFFVGGDGLASISFASLSAATDLELMHRNTRKIKKANHGARPNNRNARKAKRPRRTKGW